MALRCPLAIHIIFKFIFFKKHTPVDTYFRFYFSKYKLGQFTIQWSLSTEQLLIKVRVLLERVYFSLYDRV